MKARGGSSKRRSVVAAASFAACGALVACSAIIGTRDLTLTTVVDDGGSQSDAGSDASDSATCASLASGMTFASDPLNCGACGHDCLGGACVGAQCQPVAIVQGQPGPTSIAIDDGNVYWVCHGQDQVVKATKDGKRVTVLSSAPFASNPFAIAVDDANVYWANYQPSTDTPRILRCAKGGCASTPSPVVSNLAGPVDLAVDGANVYWVEDADPYAVGRVDKIDGGGGGTLAQAGTYTHGIAIDDTSIFFASEGFIGKIAKNAPASAFGSTFKKLFAVDPMYAYGIAVDATNVYWAVYDGPGQIFALSKGGGTPNAIATGQSFPLAVALDAANVYWINVGPNAGTDTDAIFNDGTVMSCPKSGCPASGPKTLATKQAWLQDIAVDDVAVYWSAQGNSSLDGAIVKIAK